MLMKQGVGKIGILLFGSGAAALIYQTVWLREFRLIFGGSTAASAAVLAIFLGGLGFGGFFFGPRVDRSRNPLAMYGVLEIGVAVCAALSPLLLDAVSFLYFKSGGSVDLSPVAANALRVMLAAIVLGPATLLMGGTLPAAARAVERSSDVGRTRLALLYGTNTLGAVAGTLLSTFVLLENAGNRATLWMAALLNLFIALAAILMARATTESEQREVDASPVEEPLTITAAAPRRFVFAAAATVGFVFLLMELVWYRTLAPLMGGTTFTFGLILAGALFGIGAGSFLYTAALRGKQPSLSMFAWTTAIEAMAIAIPYALGDRLAVLSLLLRAVGQSGFWGYLFGWALLINIIIVPAALLSGIQFPALVSLLGRGRESVGRDVGFAYGWNTIGSIAGSLAAGFGLMSFLTAEGSWRLACVLLASLSVAAFATELLRTRRVSISGAAAVIVSAFAVVLVFGSIGPTAVWRHSSIGAGRVNYENLDPISIEHWKRFRRRYMIAGVEGVESSVGIASEDGNALIVNGKSDGHGRADAGTQVVSGLLGALLHPNPKTVFVVGLGTGSTAGWIADAKEITSVDVVELEPAVVKLAHHFNPVNRGVMSNKKVRIRIGDGREVLLAESKRRYDLIISEPSNPYRAGVASLYTQDFYASVSRQLNEGGLFLQWVQAYEVSGPAIRTVYATYTSVFPYVYTWQTQRGDLILVGSREPVSIDLSRLAQRMSEDPYRTGLARAWRVIDPEGLIAHYVAGPETARSLAEGASLNTDDRTRIEFAFGRTVGSRAGFDVRELKMHAHRNKDDMPALLVNGVVDPLLVQARRAAMISAIGDDPFVHRDTPPEIIARNTVHAAYADGNYNLVLQAWRGQEKGPSDSVEMLTLGDALANAGSDAAAPFIALLEKEQPIEAAFVTARLRLRQQKFDDAAESLSRGFAGYRNDPWPLPSVARRAFELVLPIANGETSGNAAKTLFASMEKPFALNMHEDQRRWKRLELAKIIDGGGCGASTLAAIGGFEPHAPWNLSYLQLRAKCYAETRHARAAHAEDELTRFIAAAPQPLVGTLRDDLNSGAAREDGPAKAASPR